MDDTSRQIGELREEMRAGFKDLRTEIKDVRSEIASQINGLRSEMATQVEGLRSEMAVERGELRADLGELRKAMEFRFEAMHRWMLGTMGSMLVVLASIIVGSRL